MKKVIIKVVMVIHYKKMEIDMLDQKHGEILQLEVELEDYV